MQQQHILFTLGHAPKQGSGTPIIIDRHLRRLSSENWKISIVSTEQSIASQNFPHSWHIIPMPVRRWWWFPYRPQIPGLLDLRLRCWQSECERVLMKERPSAILTVLQDVYSLFAAHLSKTWQIPLSVIVHDQHEFWASSDAQYRCIRQNSNTVLNQAARVWPVSREIGDGCQVKETSKISVLLPISEGNYQGFVKWKDSFKSNPVIAYAGSLYEGQIPIFYRIASALKKINGTFLLIITNFECFQVDLLKLLKNCSNVKYQKPFVKNIDVITFLAENASCILVSYPLDLTKHPWIATSFPSKLIEFSHLGLPLLTLAPPSTALSNWAKRHNWLSHLSQINEEEVLKVLNQLTEKESWMKMAQQSQNVALNEFNPNVIQAQFESELAIKK